MITREFLLIPIVGRLFLIKDPGCYFVKFVDNRNMKRFLLRRPNLIPVCGLIFILVIVNVYLAPSLFPQAVSTFQKLGFGLIGVSIGVCFTVFLLNLLLVLGYLGGSVYSCTFDAAPRAMLYMRFSRIAAQIISLLLQLLRRIQAFIALIVIPEKQYSYHPFFKLTPLSDLPYELFPQSCILLN